MNSELQIQQLQQEILDLKKQNQELNERLKKYTSPARNKKFYQNHKEEVIQKVMEYKKKTGYKPDKEKVKQYNKMYNERKKKEKLELIESKLDNDIKV